MGGCGRTGLLEEAYKQSWQQRQECVWKPKVCPVEFGCWGCVSKSVLSLLTEMGIRGRGLKQEVKTMVDTEASSSGWLWVRRKVSDWGKDMQGGTYI